MSSPQPQSLMQFSEILDAQIENTLPYPSLKNLLRAVKTHHPQYPRRSQRPRGSTQICSLSQTQHPSGQLSDSDSLLIPSPTPPLSRQQPRKPPSSLADDGLPCNNLSVYDASQIRELTPLTFDSQPCKRRRVTNVPSAFQAGQAINSVLVKMADELGESVIWGDLRERLVATSPVYEGFCVSMDKLFDRNDPLSTFGISELSQCRRQCIFYSNLFWEGAWKEYWRDATRPQSRNLESPS